jgi:hypothetical protein
MSALERSVGPPGSPGPVGLPAGEADVVVVGGGVARTAFALHKASASDANRRFTASYMLASRLSHSN